jgi:hypothetical protein
MGKSQLIDRIRSHNPSAKQDFLMHFDRDALTNYLEHLKYVAQPRTGRSAWVRAAETHSVVTRAH